MLHRNTRDTPRLELDLNALLRLECRVSISISVGGVGGSGGSGIDVAIDIIVGLLHDVSRWDSEGMVELSRRALIGLSFLSLSLSLYAHWKRPHLQLLGRQRKGGLNIPGGRETIWCRGLIRRDPFPRTALTGSTLDALLMLSCPGLRIRSCILRGITAGITAPPPQADPRTFQLVSHPGLVILPYALSVSPLFAPPFSLSLFTRFTSPAR